MNLATRRRVRLRAGDRCEYCTLPQSAVPLVRFHIEHIIALKHGGNDEDTNLALACFHCNVHKGSNIAGIDPETGELMELFNPRTQHWHNHFTVDNDLILGLTSHGRTTVDVLKMNGEDLRALRREVP